MEEDMRNIFSKRQSDLEEMIETIKLTKDQKKMVLTAVEFGYAAAYCARTHDMNDNFLQAHKYETDYKQIIGKLN